MKIKPGVVEHCLVDTSKWERNTTGADTGVRGVRVLRFRRSRQRVRFGRRASAAKAVAAREIATPVSPAAPGEIEGLSPKQHSGNERSHSAHRAQAIVQARLRDAFRLLSTKFDRYCSMIGLRGSSNSGTEPGRDGPRVWS
jgi:hypothetical protein